ncbi:NAD-dependent epimerase/dehydratase family protein [Maribacter sp. 2304DJ31-5]|uniref:NAD-dependent epimerase/dehydratase family protein n=1 Tax=Maribacter sp. 2304DJ31-5 TaxID=3386273 RepID=UPI0039BCAB32
MVLVTGGTGLVGSHLLLELALSGIETRAIYRSKAKLDEVKKVFGYYTENVLELFDAIEWVQADILDVPALETAFVNIEYVYHAAALISFDPRDFNALRKINVEGTTNIVNLALEHHIKKLCYVSTIGTLGRSTDKTQTTEETEWTPQHTNVYATSKYLAEMEVWRGSQENLDVIVINPGIILGPGFWNSGSGELFKTTSKGYSYYPPGGTGFVTVKDVIKSMLALMDTSIVNERYILVAENRSFKDIMGKIALALGKKVPRKELRIWQLQLGRCLDWLRDMLTHKGRKITGNSIYSLKNRKYYDHSKIKKAIHFEFEPVDSSIEFCSKKFIEDRS